MQSWEAELRLKGMKLEQLLNDTIERAVGERDDLRRRLAEADNTVQRLKAELADTYKVIECADAYKAWAEKRITGLKEINSGLTHDHNALLIDGTRWQARAEQAEAALAVLTEAREWQPMPRCPHEDPTELNPVIASCGMMFGTREEAAAHDQTYHPVD